ncbi:hypothetical protein Tco_0609347 [Tanacetum coccineum]
MAGASGSNSFVDNLIELSGKTDPNEYLKLFVTQQIEDWRGFIARMGPEVNIAKNELGQLNALIAGIEASEDVGEVWDTIMCLRDKQRKAEAKLADLQHWLTNVEEEIVEKQKQLNIMDTQAIDDQAHLANYDSYNEIENDDLGYHSEEYFDDAHEDDENNHSNGNVVKRGITRLYKFRMEYGKPGGVKLSVTFDALNRISGKHRALFSSFLGDMVHEHIAIHDVDLTSQKLVMNRLGQLLRNFIMKLRRTYILPNQDTPSKLNEVPMKYTTILKSEDEPNFVKYIVTRAYDQAYKKETEDKIKEGALKVDQGTDSITVVLASKSDERILLLQSQLDVARRERQEKELLIQSVSGGHSSINRMLMRRAEQLLKLLNLWELRKRLDQSERILQVKIPNPKKMCRTTTSNKGCNMALKNQAIIAEGTVYKSDGKIMLHNKALPKDCYNVLIDKSLVDAAFIPDVGNNGCTTVFDAVGGFVAWPKNQVVLDLKGFNSPAKISVVTSHGKPEVGSSSVQPNCNTSSNGDNEGPNPYRNMILEAAGHDFNPNSHENVSQPQLPDPKTKRMLNIKSESRMTEKIYDDVMKVLEDALPPDSKLVGSFYETKKFASALGLPCQKISTKYC